MWVNPLWFGRGGDGIDCKVGGGKGQKCRPSWVNSLKNECEDGCREFAGWARMKELESGIRSSLKNKSRFFAPPPELKDVRGSVRSE